MGVVSRRCEHESCVLSLYLAVARIKKVLFCAQHKRPDKVNVVSRTCRQEECDTRPAFGSRKDGIRLYCNKHKLPNQFNLEDQSCQAATPSPCSAAVAMAVGQA